MRQAVWQIAYWAARMVPSAVAWNRFLQTCAVSFWLALIGGLAFFSVRAINTGLTELNVYRTLGYIPDSGMAAVLAWLGGGFVGAVWAACLAIRALIILLSGLNRINKGGALSGQLANGFYPLFAFAAMLGLATGAYFAFHYTITESIPTYVATPPDSPMRPEAWRNESRVDAFLPPLAGALAAMGALYLALRLIADAVKLFLRMDGVISETRKDGVINKPPGKPSAEPPASRPPSRVLWRRD